ncbi:DUF3859 domain-containing protein [Bacteroidota bacterium]
MKRSKKPLPQVEIISYGHYTRWDRESKDLPDLLELTDTITAELDVEFGMIVEIWQAKGRFIQFRIDHPPFSDNEGSVEPSFEGEYQIKANPYRFFLGDTIWEPVEDKIGDWTMSIFMDGELLASKTIRLFL